MTTAYENIQTETKGRVGIIRLNRPKALNALCADLVRELGQALDAFEADPGIGCMVLTGSDKAFAAGADIKEMKEKTYQDVFLQDFITVGSSSLRTTPSSASPRSRSAPSPGRAAPSACRASSASRRPWTWS